MEIHLAPLQAARGPRRVPTLDGPGAGPDLPPAWIAEDPAQSPENTRFLAGAALAALHPVAMGRCADVPLRLLADRLALLAAEASLRLMGRPVGLAALRDAVHLLRPFEHPDPAGAVALCWRQAGAQACTAGQGAAPLAAAARAFEDVLADHPGDLPGALIAAEAGLTAALGWPVPLPVLAPGLARRDLALRGTELELACARAVVRGAPRAQRLAVDLARRADRLRAVAPKLRARAAPAALDLLLRVDALTPALALSPVVRGTGLPMSDRAARRFCDRLVQLGVLREFSGRAAFRIYGL